MYREEPGKHDLLLANALKLGREAHETYNRRENAGQTVSLGELLHKPRAPVPLVNAALLIFHNERTLGLARNYGDKPRITRRHLEVLKKITASHSQVFFTADYFNPKVVAAVSRTLDAKKLEMPAVLVIE
jgi:hypothetical protein